MRGAAVAGLVVPACLALAGCKSSPHPMDMSAQANDLSIRDLAMKNVSHSKLGPYLFDFVNPDPVAAMFLAACPRVAHFTAGGSEAKNEIPAYRARCAGGQVIVRVTVPNSIQYHGTDDPVADADDFWLEMQPNLSELKASEIDWLEGPNEFDNINWVDSFMDAQWYAKFWSELADKMHAAGYNPLAGSLQGNNIPTANVDAGTPNWFCPTTDALKAKGYRWAWSSHSYTFNAALDVATNGPYAFAYRDIHTQCALDGVPLALTEGGYLTASSQGWVGQISAQQYLAWLEWFDGEMQKDPDLLGLTIFQVGDHDMWKTFSVAPIVPDLMSWLAAAH